MEILFLGNELLRQRAVPIRPINGEYQKIAKEMIDAMHRGKGCGLAGPQVGLMERIFVIHVEGDEPRVFINPSLIETSREQGSYEEGCLSIPGVWAEVIRSKAVRVQAWNEKGRPFTLEAEGLLARAIQHEYDHLEGILFIDRLSEPRRNKILTRWKKRQRT